MDVVIMPWWYGSCSYLDLQVCPSNRTDEIISVAWIVVLVSMPHVSSAAEWLFLQKWINHNLWSSFYPFFLSWGWHGFHGFQLALQLPDVTCRTQVWWKEVMTCWSWSCSVEMWVCRNWDGYSGSPATYLLEWWTCAQVHAPNLFAMLQVTTSSSMMAILILRFYSISAPWLLTLTKPDQTSFVYTDYDLGHEKDFS